MVLIDSLPFETAVRHCKAGLGILRIAAGGRWRVAPDGRAAGEVLAAAGSVVSWFGRGAGGRV